MRSLGSGSSACAASLRARERHRDTQAQDRVAIDQIPAWIDERVG